MPIGEPAFMMEFCRCDQAGSNVPSLHCISIFKYASQVKICIALQMLRGVQCN